MNRKKEKGRRGFKAGGLAIILITFLCISILVTTISFQDVVEVSQINEKKWVPYALADHNPTGDMGGYIYKVTYPNQAVPATAYATNLTPANAYEESDVINSEMNNETPHSTATDWVICFRVNDTTSYNSSSSLWEPDWIYMNATIDFDFRADVAWMEMTLYEIANNTDFAWYHGVLNNGGSGYTITNNEKFNVTVNNTLWW